MNIVYLITISLYLRMLLQICGTDLGQNNSPHFNPLAPANFNLCYHQRYLRKYCTLARNGRCFIYCAVQKSRSVAIGIISLFWRNYIRNNCIGICQMVASTRFISNACCHNTFDNSTNYQDFFTKAVFYQLIFRR